MGVRERGEPKRYNLLNVTILHGASKILRLGFIRCFRHQVLLRRQGHFYNRGRRPTCAGERHRVGLY